MTSFSRYERKVGGIVHQVLTIALKNTYSQLQVVYKYIQYHTK